MSAGVIAAHEVLGGAASPPTFGSIGAKGSGGASPILLPYPSSPGLGDIAVAGRIGWNSSQTVFDNETGWTNRADLAGGTGTAADSHSTRVHADTKVLDGTESGSVSFDSATISGAIGCIVRYAKPAGTTGWDVVATTGDDASHAADRSVTGSATISLQPGDKLVAVVATDTDVGLTITSPLFTATGITFGTVNRRTTSGEAGSTSGTDGNIEIFDADVTVGSGTVSVTFAFTTATSQCGPIAIVRIRAT